MNDDHARSGANGGLVKETAYRVPLRVFSDPSYYEREQERIFRGDSWSFVGLEVEVPRKGDYKTTFVGDSPVIVSRAADGGINVMQNRCAHRGALVCRELRGNALNFHCVYHQWGYNLRGELVGVPFRRGLGGRGGMPADFDMKRHGLRRLRVESINGLIFATFSESVEPLREYLGEAAAGHIERIMNRPIKVMGDQRQLIRGNWKLYAENVRDPYHASLLHLFHATFGLYRSTQKGGTRMDASGRHSALHAMSSTNDDERDQSAYAGVRTFNSKFKLQDPSMLSGRKEFHDDISLVILAVFPNLVLQQISNTLAVRQIIPRGPSEFELVWTHFGYADDDPEMEKIRIKQSNLIGPAGMISMEDGEAVEIVQAAIARDTEQESFIAMGGATAEESDHLVTEGTIIGFWKNYEKVVGFARRD